VYAQTNGSVAAPTAGLHFTENVFTSLLKKNIQPNFITLHVGAGTFKPVKSHIMQEHEMHAEFIDVSKSFIERLLKNLHDPVVAVGTTSLRTLESLYWLGVKQLAIGDSQSAAADIPFLSQWEAYQLAERNTTPEDSLLALLSWMQTNKLERLLAKTQILIAPGYSIKIADGLITNFHQPQSTLLLLVAALIGEQWKEVYAYALKNDFRLLWSKKS
jgi:S-adenosylmethionine:tRNA ribosyltransferase-isomerase